MKNKILLLIVAVFFFTSCGLSNVVNRGEYIEQTSIQPDIPRKELLARYGPLLIHKKMKMVIG